MDVTVAIAILLAAAGIGYAMSKASKIRKELNEFADVEKPKRLSKREKRLEQIRAGEPEYVPPTIDDLVSEEIVEIGADQIPGGEGLAPAVLLRVYRRDTAPNDDCAPADRRFVVADGIELGDAGLEDVRLLCMTHETAPPVDGMDVDDAEVNSTDIDDADEDGSGSESA